MPQLPPVAAAAFVGCLLVVIIATVVIVRVRSRRRGVRLAQMVRTTAPVPRPATSRVAQPPASTVAPLRGRTYRSAEEFGRFVVFAERPQRDPVPGRPARRLAAQLAYAAAPPTVAPPPLRSPVAPADPVPPSGEMPRLVSTSHAGLAEVVFDLNAPGELEMRAGTPARVLKPAAEPAVVEPAAAEPTVTESWAAEPPVAEPSVAEPSVAEAPVPEPPMAPVAEVPAAEPRVETPVAEPPVAEPPTREPLTREPAEAIEEAREPELASSSRRPSTPPLREPQITVLPPRPPVPALPAMMSREVTLGDAARVLRGALPSVLTMTDGRQLRRAVAVGAATSMVAAAFAIRARRR